MQTITAVKQTSVDVLQSNAFTIQSSGKMFHMVVAGLYSDKPQSITREIWSNAYDAHAMCGKADVPFEVTFPTTFMPEFACRDFGEGISHDDMQSLYTILGHSSKENTNQAVGKWGVGRMSPMSYTDSFTVTSIHKGMKAIYNVMLDDDGSPKLHTFMEPSPTDEPSGVRISFPVSRDDIGAFQKAARRVSLGFDVKPVITNKASNVSWPVLTKKFVGTNFYTYDRVNLSGSYGNDFSGFYVKMGCVLYPVDSGIIKSKLGGNNVIIEVPIGSLGVSASRESLSYGRNEPTIKTLEAAVESVQAEVAKLVEDSIALAKSHFHAYVLLCQYDGNVPKVYGNTVTWRGQKISTGQGYYLEANDYKSLTIQKLEGKTLRKPLDGSWRMHSTSKYLFVTLDVSEKKPVRLLNRLFEVDGNYSSVALVSYNSSDKDSQKSLTELVADYDGAVTFVDAHSLADPGSKKTGKRAPVKVKVISPYGDIRETDMDDAAFLAGGVYVPLVGSSPKEDHKGYRQILKLVHEKCGINTLYGINAVMMKKFEGQPQWITLKEYLTKFVDLHKDEIAFVTKFGDGYLFMDHICHKLVGQGSKEIDDLSSAINKMNSGRSGVSSSAWAYILKFTGVTVTQQPSVDIVSLNKAVEDKFPLLYQLHSNTPVQHIIPYIKALA